MRTNYVPPRHTHSQGAHTQSAVNQQPRILRFNREDFDGFLHTAVHPSRHNYLRSFFPPDHRNSRLLTTDKSRLDAFVRILEPDEKSALEGILRDDKAFINYGRMSEANAAKLKDSGRFTSDSDPQVRRPTPKADFTDVTPKLPRPAKGEDLKAPIGFHAETPQAGAKDADLYPPPGAQDKRPPSKAQERPSAPTGSVQGKPTSAPAEPKHQTLDEFLAEERAAENAKRSSQAQGRPNRVRFAEQAETRKYPVGEDFQPGAFKAGSRHNVNFGPMDKPGSYTPPENVQTKLKRHAPGREPPYPLNNSSYPPAPPPTGILKKTAQGQESLEIVPANSGQGQVEPTGQPNTSAGMSKTHKVILGGAAVLGTGIAITGVTAAALATTSTGEDSSSNPPVGT